MFALANFDVGVIQCISLENTKIKKEKKKKNRKSESNHPLKHTATKLHSRPSRFYKLRTNNSLSQKKKKKH